MEQMNITQVVRKTQPDRSIILLATIGNRVINVPLDPANRHYAEIMRQVEEGTLVISPAAGELTIQDADSPE